MNLFHFSRFESVWKCELTHVSKKKKVNTFQHEKHFEKQQQVHFQTDQKSMASYWIVEIHHHRFDDELNSPPL